MKKFETNKTYSTRSICDNECIFSYKVISRTEKTVTIIDAKEKFGPIPMRKKISVYNGEETIWPKGHHSMAPILRASEID